MARGQLKVFETIAVLMVFLMLVGVGMSVYFAIQRAEIQDDIQRLQDLRVIQTVKRATFLPELDCVVAGAQTELCFDAIKLDELSGVLATPSAATAYLPVFGYSTLNVTQVYPSRRSWVVYDRQRSGDVRRFQSPVLVYDPVRFSYGFGVVEVTSYG